MKWLSLILAMIVCKMSLVVWATYPVEKRQAYVNQCLREYLASHQWASKAKGWAEIDLERGEVRVCVEPLEQKL